MGPAPRLAIGFASVFFMLGVYVPFWPVWLAARGLSPELIGVALGLGAWARLLANPVIGGLADRTGRTRSIAMLLGLAVLATFVAFSFAHDALALLVLSGLLGLTFAPLAPLLDATAVTTAALGTIDYGRVRLWGSVAFIAASVGVGRLLESATESAILATLCGTAVVITLAMAQLPVRERAPSTQQTVGVRGLLAQPRFRLLMIACATLHSSHAVLYAYGTPHWRAAGISDTTIGVLWAEGVLAEILLFSIAPKIAGRLRPPTLLAIAGLAGLARWPALALTVAVPWLMLAQLLHGLTFAATHLGAMTMIREEVPGTATGAATALYAGIATGLAFGIGLPLAGLLYTKLGGQAYWVMAGVSLSGIVAALLLHRRRDADATIDDPPATRDDDLRGRSRRQKAS